MFSLQKCRPVFIFPLLVLCACFVSVFKLRLGKRVLLILFHFHGFKARQTARRPENVVLSANPEIASCL